MSNPPKLSKEVVEFEFNRIRSLIEPHFSDDFAGYHVPKGWMFIVERLHKELVAVHPTYRVGQVKEKYGTLRFYVEIDWSRKDAESLDKTIFEIISRFEDESSITCEDCGSSQGRMRDVRSYYSTLCNFCLSLRSK